MKFRSGEYSGPEYVRNIPILKLLSSVFRRPGVNFLSLLPQVLHLTDRLDLMIDFI